jgi:MerR family transcriptional regulator, light-induced transcriptional regulator
MNAFTIRDLETLSGIKAHTIRIWEQRYSLLKPQRTDTNIRYYSNEELKNLLNVALLNKYGYKISHITRMSAQELKERILQLNQADALQERIMTDLIHHMVDLDMESFEQMLNKVIAVRGIEKAIVQIIFPFLERIGILWQTDNINPAQEHLVTNVIRQKIIVGIEHTVSHIQTRQTVLLFLPEAEHHELGLLFVQFLMKSRGVRTVYLGSNVPIKDLPMIVSVKKPDFLYTHITSLHVSTGFEKFLNNMNKYVPEYKLIISGIQAQNYSKALPPQVEVKNTIQQVTEFIAMLN